MSVRTSGRDLTQEERLALIPYQNSLVVKEYMEQKTKTAKLGFADRLAFSALKQSCVPLSLHIQKIEREEEVYPDQTKVLLQLYGLCSEGTMGLSRLYIKAQKPE
jgi:hypothetical protein